MATTPSFGEPSRPAIPWLLFLGSSVVSLLTMLIFEGDVLDATTRTLYSVAWVENPLERIGTHYWGDGNFLLPGLVVALGGDLFWAVRIVYALIGAATIPALYLLTAELFDRRTALWAALLFALNPFRIAFSLQGATGEIPYLLPAFIGLLIVIRHRSRPTLLASLGAGICFTIAISFRFEAGFWAMIASFLLLTPPEHRYRFRLEGRRVAAFVAFCAAGLSYPVFLVFRWWQVYGDPAYYFTLQSINQGQFYGSGQNPNWPDAIYIPYSATFWVTGAILILTPLVALPAFIGVVRAMRRHASAAWIALGIVGLTLLFSVQSVRSSRFPLEYRYALVLHGLLCMFVPLGWQWIGERLPRFSRPRVQVAAMVASVLICYTAYSIAAFVDDGVVGRRLGILSPVRPGQYETRKVFNWVEQEMPRQRMILSPCVRATYALLRRRDLIADGRLRGFSEYRDDIRVYNRADYMQAFEVAVRDYDLAVFNRRCQGLGLTDGRIEDPFLPPRGQAVTRFGPFSLKHLRDVGGLSVFQVQ